MNDLIEKLSILRNQLNCFDENERDVYSTLSEAIKVLSERPEPCEDVVSRKTAIEAVMDLCKHYTPTKSVKHPHVDFVIEALQNLPSAQPEIIRCKDCKWWSNDDYRECSSPNYDDGYVTPAGFYCGYAERRTDERTD